MQDQTLVSCGPVAMQQKILEITTDLIDPNNNYVILEPYMKCGRGLCASCSTQDGLITCEDGHILTATKVKDWDLLSYKRDKFGARKHDY